MGYEVLDADGAASDVSSGPYPPVEVVALDDLPLPPQDAGRARRDRSPGGGRGRAGWDLRSSTALRRLVERTRRTPRLTWVLVAVAALVGVAAGSWWGARHGEQVRRAEARAAVQAFVAPVAVNPLVTGRGTVADYTIRLVNLGSQPLTVQLSGDDLGRSATPAISMVTGENVVPAGTEVLVKARVPLDCTSSEPVALRLPVQSSDGTLHSVPLRDGVETGVDLTPTSLCSFTQGQEVLSASLTGTLDRPVLELRNNSDRALLVALDSGSPLTQTASQLLSLTTVPKLPVVVRSHDTTSLRLQLTVATCRRDLSTLSALSGYGYLGFQGESVGPSRRSESGGSGGSGGDGLDGGAEANAGVDASPLVGAALAKACQPG